MSNSQVWQIFVRLSDSTVAINNVRADDTIATVKLKLQEKQGKCNSVRVHYNYSN